jgi:hypothetical protein
VQVPRRIRLRLPARTSRCAALALIASVAFAAPGFSTPAGVPTGSTPLAISYDGSFDLTNTMIPVGVQHSYAYHVEWAYSWAGSWGQLFQVGSRIAIQTSFQKAGIAGNLHVTWRSTTSGPDLRCTLRIVPSTSDFPDFGASYDPAKGTVRISGLEAPTYRYATYVGSSDPMCGGGPEIDIFGQPSSWKPLGDGGGALSLSTGGTHAYDRTWAWSHSFGGGERRSYTSSIRSTLRVSFGRPAPG